MGLHIRCASEGCDWVGELRHADVCIKIAYQSWIFTLNVQVREIKCTHFMGGGEIKCIQV